MLGFLGLPRVAALALAILLIEQTHLSLEDLAHRTGYARSCLSSHLKSLAARGLVEITREGKRVLYRARAESITKLLVEHLASLRALLITASQSLERSDISWLLKGLSNDLSRIIGKFRSRGGVHD